MDILDLKLQWHWAWVLQMGSSYCVIEFQRELWTRNFQQYSTTTERSITDSIIPFRVILVYQLWIYLPLPLMIDTDCIKEPVLPHIWFQIQYMLPLKTMLLIWLPFLICHNSFYYLMMILKLTIQWRNVSLTMSVWK